MIQLEVFGESATMTGVAESSTPGRRQPRRAVTATRPGHVLVAGLVRPNAIDPLMDELGRLRENPLRG